MGPPPLSAPVSRCQHLSAHVSCHASIRHCTVPERQQCCSGWCQNMPGSRQCHVGRPNRDKRRLCTAMPILLGQCRPNSIYSLGTRLRSTYGAADDTLAALGHRSAPDSFCTRACLNSTLHRRLRGLCNHPCALLRTLACLIYTLTDPADLKTSHTQYSAPPSMGNHPGHPARRPIAASGYSLPGAVDHAVDVLIDASCRVARVPCHDGCLTWARSRIAA